MRIPLLMTDYEPPARLVFAVVSGLSSVHVGNWENLSSESVAWAGE